MYQWCINYNIDMTKYYYLCIQNLWSPCIYLWFPNPISKPRNLSWAGYDFQTVDCPWSISTWHTPEPHIMCSTSPALAFPSLGGIPIHTQLPKQKPGSYPLLLSAFWEVVLSSCLFTTSLCSWPPILFILFTNTFQSCLRPSPSPISSWFKHLSFLFLQNFFILYWGIVINNFW